VGIKDYLGVLSALLGTRGKVILSFVGGFVIGLVILGWVIWPVQWKDAAPVDLQQDYRQAYLHTVARISEADPGVDLNRMLGGDSWSEEKLSRDLNQAYDDAPDTETRTRLDNLARRLGIEIGGTPEEKKAGRSLLGILAVAVVVMLAAASAFFLLRIRQQASARPVAIGGDPDKVAAARSVWDEGTAPLLQVTTSYALGDDYYDPSFSIELSSGEFLGECGVGISEAIGVDEPKKVTAFEVWLFDKSQISTVTKVLMSEYCYSDDALRSKLAPKGEPVLGQEGAVIELATTGLRIQAKILEMEYGVGNLPPNSFVTRLTIELAAWKLEGAEEGLGLPSVSGVESERWD
jgi:hypothetical protein